MQKLEDDRLECHSDDSVQQPARLRANWNLGSSTGERSTLMKAYKRATQEPFGHLMIDLDARSSRNLRYCSHCSADEPTHFYCATDQLFISVNDEFTKLLYS